MRLLLNEGNGGEKDFVAVQEDGESNDNVFRT